MGGSPEGSANKEDGLKKVLLEKNWSSLVSLPLLNPALWFIDGFRKESGANLKKTGIAPVFGSPQNMNRRK